MTLSSVFGTLCVTLLALTVMPSAHASTTCLAHQYLFNDATCNICRKQEDDSVCKNCAPCVVGKYRDNCRGTSGTSPGECKTCPSGKFQDSSTAYKSACTPYTPCSCGQRQKTAPSLQNNRVCEACPANTYNTATMQSTNGGGYKQCHDIVNCGKGTIVKQTPTACRPRVCANCPAGRYMPLINNAGPCALHTPCTAGHYIKPGFAGSESANRQCLQCANGSYQAGSNKVSCDVWRTCAPGTYVHATGSRMLDRVCKANPPQHHTTQNNQVTPVPWQTCPSTVNFVEGTASKNRVCCNYNHAVHNMKCHAPSASKFMVLNFAVRPSKADWCDIYQNSEAKGKMEDCTKHAANSKVKKQCVARRAIMKMVAKAYKLCDDLPACNQVKENSRINIRCVSLNQAGYVQTTNKAVHKGGRRLLTASDTKSVVVEAHAFPFNTTNHQEVTSTTLAANEAAAVSSGIDISEAVTSMNAASEPGETPLSAPKLEVVQIRCVAEGVFSVLNAESREYVRTPVHKLKVGDAVLTANGATTKVEAIHTDAAPCSQLFKYGNTVVTANHAIKTKKHGWRLAKDVGERATQHASKSKCMKNIYSIKTSSHCNDDLLVDDGTVIESWDGRAPYQIWRPYWIKDGVRHRCADMGTRLETFYSWVDYAKGIVRRMRSSMMHS